MSNIGVAVLKMPLPYCKWTGGNKDEVMDFLPDGWELTEATDRFLYVVKGHEKRCFNKNHIIMVAKNDTVVSTSQNQFNTFFKKA